MQYFTPKGAPKSTCLNSRILARCHCPSSNASGLKLSSSSANSAEEELANWRSFQLTWNVDATGADSSPGSRLAA